MQTAPATEDPGHRSFDAVTIGFHWATAALVLALFGTAMAWTYLPREWGLRSLSGVHVSLGMALAAVIVGRMIWRVTAGRHLAAAGSRVTKQLALMVHLALYGLLLLQIALGIGLQWLGGDSLSFFGVFGMASPLIENRDLSHQLEAVHEFVAWSLMGLVAVHALAALLHHYVLKDGVLLRMLPALARQSQGASSAGDAQWNQ